MSDHPVEVTDMTDMAVTQWSAIHPDFDAQIFQVGLRIRRLASILATELEVAVQSHGFSVLGDYDVAALLRRTDRPVRARDISAQLRITASGLTGRLDRLEADGVVRRRPDDSDGRAISVELTAQGVRKVDAALDAVMASQQTLFSALSPSSMKQMTRALWTILGESDTIPSTAASSS